MNSRTAFGLAVAMMTLSGCVPSSQSIKPVPANQSAFSGMDCATLDARLAAARAELAELSAKQDRINSNDATNIVFFELRLANALDKRGQKRIGVLKGEIAAKEAERAAKGCTSPPAQ